MLHGYTSTNDTAQNEDTSTTIINLANSLLMLHETVKEFFMSMPIKSVMSLFANMDDIDDIISYGIEKDIASLDDVKRLETRMKRDIAGNSCFNSSLYNIHENNPGELLPAVH